MESIAARELLKALIAEGALALACLYAVYDRQKLLASQRWLNLALIILVFAATAAWFEFGWLRYGKYMNPHDVYHYYVGAKYAPELGYTKLYGASLAAEAELGTLPASRRAVRNLDDHSYTPASLALADRDRYTGNFTDERWNEFKRDVAWFRDQVPRAKWEDMLRDKGYNGTPVWSMIAGAIANRVPTSSERGMTMLVTLDLALIVLMLGFIAAAFGPRIALFSLVFFGTNFVMSFVHIKGAFLRLDWCAAIVIALCLLRMKRFGFAGAALAYAVSVRVFPLIFVGGIAARMIWRLLETRRIDRGYILFFAAFLTVTALLTGLSFVQHGAPTSEAALWNEFMSKIQVHNDDISTTRVGFKYIFLANEQTAAQKAHAFEAQQAEWWAIQVFVLVLTFFACRRLRDYEAFALGFVPLFFLTAPTFYYYVLLIVPLLFFLPRLDLPPRLAGVIALFGFSIAGYVLHQFYGLGFALSFYLSSMLFGLAVYQLFLSLSEQPYESPVELLPPVRRLAWAAPVTAFTALLLAIILLPVWDNSPSTARADSAPIGPSLTQPPALQPGEVSLVLAGDVMLGRNVERSIRAANRDFRYPFEATAELTRTATIAFANLECPISGRGTPLAKTYLFNAPADAVDGLKFAGFDLVSLANNHTLDYGPIALEDTQSFLSRAGITAVGIATEGRPQSPVIYERNGLRVGFLAYADPQSPFGYAKEFAEFETGPAKAEDSLVADDIRRLRARVNVVVVSVHWGIEYAPQADDRQRALGRLMIDAGAQLVVGHHPHVLQETEWYNGGLILYSLGNFVFDQHTRPLTRVSRLYRLILSAEGVRHAAFLPLHIDQTWQPRPAAEVFEPLPRTVSRSLP